MFFYYNYIMKLNLKKIININNIKELKKFPTNKPVFKNNYLFHYLIIFGCLNALKLERFPIHIENNDMLNGFHLAAKEYNYDILCYLIENYHEYIYNLNERNETFANFIPIEEIIKIMTKFPNLDWEYLLEDKNDTDDNIVLKNIIINSNYTNINKFLKLYKVQFNIQYFFTIIENNILTNDEKIKILNQYNEKELNMKTKSNEGLILITINNNNMVLFDYLLSRNIDTYYYTMVNTYSPMATAIARDIINNKYYFSKKLLEIISKSYPLFYKDNNKTLDNILHTVLYCRLNKKNIIQTVKEYNNMNYDLDMNFLKYGTSEEWNQKNKLKVSPIEIITQLDYDIYSKFINKNIKITKDNMELIKKYKDCPKWIKFFEQIESYENSNNNDINLEMNTYSHVTLFKASPIDASIYFIYLQNKYKQLYIPQDFKNLIPLQINNNNDISITTNNNIEYTFPWIIYYSNINDYFIHPYLNNSINSNKNKKDYSAVLISINYEKILHANILIYDFKRMTIERFEPYGNSTDNDLDNILEEELTWNTNFKYMRPKDFLPSTGFQTISEETKISNLKTGDLGGFCLAWCIWYLETRMNNSNISSMILVEKLIKRINNMDIKFVEYIRNYSNKLANERNKYLKKIGINENRISNSYLTSNEYDMIKNNIHNTFTNII
jgi:hypothetical protein